MVYKSPSSPPTLSKCAQAPFKPTNIVPNAHKRSSRVPVFYATLILHSRAKLPLYGYSTMNKTTDENRLIAHDDARGPPVAFLDTLLGEVISGDCGFVAQLSEGCHLKKRPTVFRVDKVLQPFDDSKSNFSRVGLEEVLLQFEAGEDNEIQFIPAAPVHVENSLNDIAINVSSIEYGHVLLIPSILKCMPKRIDYGNLKLALHMAMEAGSPYFRLGDKSLGAFATINHLHFQPLVQICSCHNFMDQAYYLALPFPIEKACTQKLTNTVSGMKISELLNYPVWGFIFEGGNFLQDFSEAISGSCICLQDNNIPYNVLISDSGKRVFIIPQCYAEKQALGEVDHELLDTQVNPAVWEISGHMVLKRKDYEEASEENAWRLLAEVSLSKARFKEVKALVLNAIDHHTNEI